MGTITKHIGPVHATPYAISRLSPKIDLAELASDLNIAHKQVANSVSIKLKLIQDQIEHLQREAIRIVEDAKLNMELHNIPCSVMKRVGVSYFLYERSDGSQFLSILSPEDWGNMLTAKFKSCWKLEGDMSWSEVL
jgi:hypothetical protein